MLFNTRASSYILMSVPAVALGAEDGRGRTKVS